MKTDNIHKILKEAGDKKVKIYSTVINRWILIDASAVVETKTPHYWSVNEYGICSSSMREIIICK